MYLSVVIPAFNEEKRLPETLKKVKAYLEKQSYIFEVLIVNDGSKDRTAQCVEPLIKEWNNALGSPPFASGLPNPPTRHFRMASSKKLGHIGAFLDRPSSGGIPSGSFKLIDNKINRGKGAVVKQGMLAAKGEWRLYMDADNSTDLSEIEKLWPYIKDYEVIAGSRYLRKDSIKIKQPLLRRIVSRVGNILIRVLLGIHSADTQCGFKLFSAKVTKEIFPLQTMERWGAEMEVWAIAIKKGYKVREVAVDWYDAAGSKVRKSAALQTLKELIIIKWNLLRGKYS